MADISDVDTDTIKDLYEALESLSCMILFSPEFLQRANPLSHSSHHDTDTILDTCY